MEIGIIGKPNVGIIKTRYKQKPAYFDETTCLEAF